MKTIDPDVLMTALGQALEIMAFIAIEPATEQPGADALQISLDFAGPVNGQLTVRAPAALGIVIAANLAATEPHAEPDRVALHAVVPIHALLHRDAARKRGRRRRERGHEAVAGVLHLGATRRRECLAQDGKMLAPQLVGGVR